MKEEEEEDRAKLMICVKFDVAVLGSPSLIRNLKFFLDVKHNERGKRGRMEYGIIAQAHLPAHTAPDL